MKKLLIGIVLLNSALTFADSTQECFETYKDDRYNVSGTISYRMHGRNYGLHDIKGTINIGSTIVNLDYGSIVDDNFPMYKKYYGYTNKRHFGVVISPWSSGELRLKVVELISEKSISRAHKVVAGGYSNILPRDWFMSEEDYSQIPYYGHNGAPLVERNCEFIEK